MDMESPVCFSTGGIWVCDIENSNTYNFLCRLINHLKLSETHICCNFNKFVISFVGLGNTQQMKLNAEIGRVFADQNVISDYMGFVWKAEN